MNEDLRISAEDAELDALARGMPAVPDDGFTDAVMTRIPVSRVRPWWRAAILTASCVAATLVALFFPPLGEVLSAGLQGASSGGMMGGATPVALFLAGMLMASVAFVVADEA